MEPQRLAQIHHQGRREDTDSGAETVDDHSPQLLTAR